LHAVVADARGELQTLAQRELVLQEDARARDQLVLREGEIAEHAELVVEALTIVILPVVVHADGQPVGPAGERARVRVRDAAAHEESIYGDGATVAEGQRVLEVPPHVVVAGREAVSLAEALVVHEAEAI